MARSAHLNLRVRPVLRAKLEKLAKQVILKNLLDVGAERTPILRHALNIA